MNETRLSLSLLTIPVKLIILSYNFYNLCVDSCWSDEKRFRIGKTIVDEDDHDGKSRQPDRLEL